MSIDAKELRIGNYVDLNGSVTQIGYGYIGDLYQKQKGIENNYLNVLPVAEGVTLTPEILEKCGFKEKYVDTWFPHWQIKHTRINGLVEYTFKIDNIGGDEWRWIEGNVNVPFYYVHQLQNLYFALTGTEINLTL